MQSKLQVASPLSAFPLKQKLTISLPVPPQHHSLNSGRSVVPRASAGDVYNIVSKPAIAANRATEVNGDEQSGSARQFSSALPNVNQGAPGRSAQKAFARASSTLTRFGWLGFMLQLILTLASSILLVFEVAFTPRNGPAAALYLVLLGIAAGLASIATNFRYVRMGARMRNALLGRHTKPIRKGAVLGMVARGVVINCLGLGLALMAMQALVAQLLMQPLALPEGIAPMLTGHSSPDALLSSWGSLSAQTIDPYLTLDVFLFQSASNMLLSHFLSLVCSLWLLSAVGRGHTARVQKLLTLRKNKKQGNAPATSDDKVVISKGNAARYIIDPTQIGSGTADGENDIPAGSTSRSTLFSGSDISSALASALRSARARNHPWTEPVSTVASVEDPMAAWFMDSEALNGAGRASSGVIGSPEMEGLLDPLGLWDPTPPVPMNGKGPQWGSKIRVSTGGSKGEAGNGGSDSSGGGSKGGRAGRPISSSSPSGAVRGTSKGRQTSSMNAARMALGLTLPAKTSTMLETKIAQRVPTSLPVIPLADVQSLSYLDGHLPGDMGFDPLHLFDPANGGSGLLSQDWLRYAEVVHGRWAMLGVVGCLTPEALAMRGTIPEEKGVEWFRTGFLPTVGQDVDFGWDPYSIAWVQFSILAVAEMRRLQDYKKPGCLAADSEAASDGSEPVLRRELEMALSTPPGGDPVYPGGPVFNFLDVVESASATRRFKEKEIKHGRLAMVAMLGFFVQAAYTGVGPYSNLVEHVMDPFGENIITNLFGLKQ